ncbi:MAG: type II toxin-antitoxin system RelE/ParE family toxin [Parachlamydia sp.]|nr:type II toxin-antitoxin system RelE/ParE family toxin [Parachlamydia sp.]
MLLYKIYTVTEYSDWYEAQTYKSQRQVAKRLSKIEEEGYFGHGRDLDENGDGLQELKFNDGRRIYYVIIPEDNVVLLLGGNKNGQDKDIKKARGIISKAQAKVS